MTKRSNPTRNVPHAAASCSIGVSSAIPVAPKPYHSADGITIYHGDCAEIAPTLGLFDLLCTDPPYGIGEARGRDRSKPRHGKMVMSRDYGNDSWDDILAPLDLIHSLQSLCRYHCIFGGNFYYLPPTNCWLIWDKQNGASDFADAEIAWTNYNRAIRIHRHLWNGMCRAGNEPRYHPTQKPLAVMSWAIGLCPERPTTVLDPFMGSGTTLRACKDLGISCVGIEREEKYCEIAVKRLAQQTLDLGDAP